MQMLRAIEYPLSVLRRSRVIGETSPVTELDGPKIAFKLLIVFLLVLYSSIPAIYKLDALRPALLIALSALVMMIIELAQLRQSFRLMWPQSTMVLAFFGACIISISTAIRPDHAFQQTIEVGKIVLVYLLLENVITSEDRLRKIMYTLVIGGIFPAIGVITHYKEGILFEHSRAGWRGVFANPNDAAYGLIILVPIALILASKTNWPVRIGIWAILATYILAIFLTFSRGGLLALFGVILLMGYKQKSALIRMAMAAGLVGGIVVIGLFWTRSSGGFTHMKQDGSVQERMATLKAGVRMFRDHPFVGVGPGESSAAYALYTTPEEKACGCHDQLVVHNAYIQAFAELGLAGAIPFMIFMFVSLYQAWRLESGPLGSYAMALELAMWGIILCCLSGGFIYTWWPYILVGMIAAGKRISESASLREHHL